MIILYNHRFFNETNYICFNEIKGKYYYTLLLPLIMNKMNNFNLSYKIKKAKTEKSGAVDRLKMVYI